MGILRGASRREFLRRAPLDVAGLAAFPTIVKASALGRGGAVAPSDRIVMAGIGARGGCRRDRPAEPERLPPAHSRT